MENSKLNETQQRLYHLDWLRVMAICLLIFYHTGMVFVPDWGFHFKVKTDDYWLQNVMLLLSPWRMGLLWFISGVALRFMWHKFSLLDLLWRRSRALLLPLLTGVVLVVPPQLYIEMKQAGDMPLSFGAFLHTFYWEPKHYFDDYQSGILPRFDVNHLWFLRSLWQFSIVLILVSPMLLSRYFQKASDYLSKNIIALSTISVVMVLLIETLLIGEQKREMYGAYFLLVGFAIGHSNVFWDKVNRNANWLVLMAAVSLLSLQLVFCFVWQTDIFDGSKLIGGLVIFIYSVAKIFPVFAALSLACKFLNRKSVRITLLNQWVFPIYVLHQTIIVVVAYFVSGLSFPVELSLPVTLLITFSLCFISIKLMQSFTGVGIFIGLKSAHASHWSCSSYWRWLVTLLCLPLAVELVL